MPLGAPITAIIGGILGSGFEYEVTSKENDSHCDLEF